MLLGITTFRAVCHAVAVAIAKHHVMLRPYSSVRQHFATPPSHIGIVVVVTTMTFTTARDNPTTYNMFFYTRKE